ncbi:MAG: hypothetical protein U5L72_05045 [Bacteroidales bacterium]|nr:hypothetical protein [Bacteroidales bacterium]
MAYVASKSGSETLRILRNINTASAKKRQTRTARSRDRCCWTARSDKDNVVQGLVLKFDDSFRIYIHQPSAFSQQWDNGARRYIIESDWQQWRIEDSRDKEVQKYCFGK